MCVRARAFRVNKFSLIYRCSLLYIHCCLLNIMRLTPDPVLIFVTLSWPRFLTQSRTSDAMQVSLLVSLSVKWYICLSWDSNPLSHEPEALSWTKHVDQTSASGLYDENDQYNEHIPCVVVVVVVVCSGLTSLTTIFQSYHDGVWLRQGAQCSLLLCCVNEVSCPRHLTEYHTQSHYPDTASTSPSSSQ